MVAAPTRFHEQTEKNGIRQGSARTIANVGRIERILSLAGGGVLAAWGLHRGNLAGFGLAALGGALMYRGASGRCAVYSALHFNTAEPHGKAAAVAASQGVKVVEAAVINHSTKDLFQMWRDFGNLPRFMSHLVDVKVTGNRSHWTAKGPGGSTVTWDAEIVNEEPNRLIAWRSLEGSQIATAGSVHFKSLGTGRGTEVLVELKYDPPGGQLGSWLAGVFGEDPSVQVREDLHRFKQIMEAGEVPTVEV